MKIAVDAMGGDYAPEEVVKGVEAARDRYSQLEFQVFGDEAAIQNCLQSSDRITLVPTSEVITMGEEPVKAVKQKKDSSLVQAAQAVANGEADAVFSAGNTGAILTAAIFIVGRIKGVDRPALASALPAYGGPHKSFVLMDMGANAENKAAHLYQYSILGSFYAKEVLGYDHPRVRLLNNGGEEDKGDDVHKAAHQLMKQSGFVNFLGNVEAREILEGTADVVVADGFSGNTALKAIEGTALTTMGQLKTAITAGGLRGKLGALFLKPALKSLKNEMNFNEQGGAVVLGVKAPVVKAHGSSKAVAVANAMGQIQTMVQEDLTGKSAAFIAENRAALKGKKE
ncbi:phosphate acyltransferase PlsX [Leuconostocaceae bacterium ESL0958]|nr:phosphate acyltransferase PlsX [Leuconostocaceae bacterium ESL0958]